MISLHEIIGFSLGGAIISTMVLGIFLSAFMPLDRWSKRYFITLFSLMLPCSVICFLALVFWYNPSMAVASKNIYLLEGVFIVTPVFMTTLFLLHYSGEKNQKQPVVLACYSGSRCFLHYTGSRSVHRRLLLRYAG